MTTTYAQEDLVHDIENGKINNFQENQKEMA